MIVTLREELLHPNPRYCGLRPRYIPYESIYSILCRFALFNVTTGGALVKTIKQHCGSQSVRNRHSKNLSYIESMGFDGLQELFGLSPRQVKSLFLTPTHISSDRHVASEFRYCPICLSQGRHYTLFQYALIESCPVHAIGLLGQCQHCGANMSYELKASLFKHPYGCWRCGRQLGEGRDPQSLRFISAPGMERLRQIHRMLGVDQKKHVVFDIAGPAELQCDNVLQLSESTQYFARVEANLFRDLLVMACDPLLQSAPPHYPTFSSAMKSKEEEFEVAGEILVNDLVSISKSIFRHFKKQYFAHTPLTDRLLEMLWRDIQGVSLPVKCYSALAYLDWLCYWRYAKVPHELLGSAQGSKKKIVAWIAEKKRHNMFQRIITPTAERWLLRQILGCEIVTLLKRQMEQAKELTKGLDTPRYADVPYRRFLHPVCWAVVFAEQSTGSPKMTFISAHSWKAGCEESLLGLTSAETKSLHQQDWVKVFR